MYHRFSVKVMCASFWIYQPFLSCCTGLILQSPFILLEDFYWILLKAQQHDTSISVSKALVVGVGLAVGYSLYYALPRLTGRKSALTKITDISKGRFTRYCFCLQLSYATFVARTACVRQRSYTTLHSNILIVATTVVRVLNKTCFKILRHFSCCVQLWWRCSKADLDDTIRVADMM